MPRVIFIDKLMRAVHGHNLEYCQRVAESFAPHGYLPVYLANRKFVGKPPAGVVNTIDFDFERYALGASAKATRKLEKARQRELAKARGMAERRFSSIGIASAVLNELGAKRQTGKVTHSNALGALAWIGASFLFKLLKVLALLVVWPFRTFLRLIVGLLALIFGGIAKGVGAVSRTSGLARWLGARTDRIRDELAIGPRLDLAKKMLGVLLTDEHQKRNQVRSIGAALKRLRLQPDDVIICSTIKEPDLAVFAAIWQAFPWATQPTWHFIMREPIFDNEGPSYMLGQSHRSLRALLLEMRAITTVRSRWWVDTEELADQYNHLGAFEFRPLAIPVPKDLADMASDPTPTDRHLVFGYLGDARPEKGYGSLPQIFEELSYRKAYWLETTARALDAEIRSDERLPIDIVGASSLRDRIAMRRRREIEAIEDKILMRMPTVLFPEPPRVNAIIQSNFNVPRGTKATRAARLRLVAQDDLGVSVFTKAPTSGEYLEAIRSIDAFILNYAHPLYHVGSSGIFAESLSAGRPMVVTDNTWGGRCLRTAPPFISHLSAFIEENAMQTPETGVIDSYSNAPWRLIPRGCTHEAIIADFDVRSISDQLIWYVDFELPDGKIVSCRRNLCSREGRAAAVIRIPRGAVLARRHIERLDPQLSENSFRLRLFDMNASNTTKPMFAIGAIVGGDHELADSVAEIATHFEHYRSSCASYAQEWAKRHAPSRIAYAMLDKNESQPPKNPPQLDVRGTPVASSVKPDSADSQMGIAARSQRLAPKLQLKGESIQ